MQGQACHKNQSSSFAASVGFTCLVHELPLLLLLRVGKSQAAGTLLRMPEGLCLDCPHRMDFLSRPSHFSGRRSHTLPLPVTPFKTATPLITVRPMRNSEITVFKGLTAFLAKGEFPSRLGLGAGLRQSFKLGSNPKVLGLQEVTRLQALELTISATVTILSGHLATSGPSHRSTAA